MRKIQRGNRSKGKFSGADRKDRSSGRRNIKDKNQPKERSSKTSGSKDKDNRFSGENRKDRSSDRRNTQDKKWSEEGASKTSGFKGKDNRFAKITTKPADKPRNDTAKKKDDSIRLNRFLANAGVCSRREADVYISSGVVTVNGKVVTEMGHQVKRTDDVRFDGRQLLLEKKQYILLNKPKGFVTTVEDKHAKKIVMDLIEGACEERVYPVGRLDKDTTGLLLFTNDGELTKKLTHPKHNHKKIYHAFLDKEITKSDLQKIADGFELEDGFIAADSVSFVEEDDKRQVGIEIHSGRNRIVRRIFAHLGYTVEKLDRVYFAGLTKKNLPRGKWRFITPKELDFLKMGNF